MKINQLTILHRFTSAPVFVLACCLALITACNRQSSNTTTGSESETQAASVVAPTNENKLKHRDRIPSNSDPVAPTAASKKSSQQADKTKADKSADKETNDQTASKPDQNKNKNAKADQEERVYRDGEIHRNNTLLLLADQPDIRANHLINNVRMFIDDDQAKLAKAIAREYDETYAALLQERTALFTEANDIGSDAESFADNLLTIKKKVADVNREVKLRVMQEVLSIEQRKKVKARYANKNQNQNK